MMRMPHHLRDGLRLSHGTEVSWHCDSIGCLQTCPALYGTLCTMGMHKD